MPWSGRLLVEGLSAALAILAALAWIRCATVKVKAEHQSGLNAAVVGGWVHFTSGGITYDLHKTLRLQSKSNAYPAFLAAGAAFCQVVSIISELRGRPTRRQPQRVTGSIARTSPHAAATLRFDQKSRSDPSSRPRR